jgi:hypothetical protein
MRPEKASKQILLFGLWYANAVVLYLDFQIYIAGKDPAFDRLSLFTILNRIRE